MGAGVRCALFLAGAGLGACDAPGPHALEEEAPPPGALGTLVVHVDRAPTDGGDLPRLWLRTPAGETRIANWRDFQWGGSSTRFEGLEPGAHELALRLGARTDGPWLFEKRTVEVASGETVPVQLGWPTGRDAVLEIAPDPDSPPFFLALAVEGTRFPRVPSSLRGRLDEARFPEEFVLTMQSDGRSRLEDVPTVPPGTYTLLVVANDWQQGDPVPLPRTIEVVARSGRTTTVRLEGKLTRLRAD